jgi:CHAD domain-containing protein
MNDQSALRPGRAAGPALRAFGRAAIADARAALGPENPDAVAVHEFRRAMKRWRALTRLLTPSVGDAEQLRIAARDLARALGGTRDTQAALDALADLGSRTRAFRRGRWPASARGWMSVCARATAMPS